MKATRLLFVTLTAVLLFVFVVATPPAPSAAQPSAPAAAQDTATATPGGCDGWQADVPYPVPVMANAVVSLNGRIYSFGGGPSSYPSSTAAYRFDGSIWTQIASLPVSLTFASAVSDGSSIYIVNGRSSSDTGHGSKTLYRYNPATDSYTQLASSRFATALAASAYLDGKIYRVGGVSPITYQFNPDPPTSAVEIYDISTDTWDTGSNYPLAVSDEVSIALNGYIYVAGGLLDASVTNKTYRYDTTTNLWEDEPIADLPSGRFDATSGLLNGKWTIAGGSGNNHDTLQWDASSNTWIIGASMLQPVGFAGGAVLDNYFYVIGGMDNFSGISTTQRYANTCPPPTGTPPSPTPTTPVCEQWQQQPAYPEPVSANAVASTNTYLYSFGGLSYIGYAQHSYKYDGHHWTQLADLPIWTSDASAVSDGQYIYVINGNIPYSITNVVYRYDPIADSYITLTHALFPTGGQGAAYLNNKIYIIGGNTSSQTNQYTSTVQVYDLTNNTWSRAANFPTVSILAQVVVINGYIYAANGTKTYRYDAATNIWSDSAVADTPASYDGLTTGVLNGQWILTGGEYSEGSAIIWNPATNTWRSLPNTLVPREWSGGGTLDNAFYSIGGFHYSRTMLLYGSNDNQRYTYNCAGTPTPQPSPTLCATTFTDISGNVFFGAIQYLYCRGAVSGTDATHYSPAATSTRGQFARVVVKGFGIPITTPSGGQSFSDVPPGFFAYNYIETGLAASILSGYDANTCAAYNAAFPCYLPNKPITRAELTRLVVKAAGYNRITPTTPTFVDVPPSYFAYIYIETAYAHGVIRGTDATHFSPNRPIRRDEMAQVVYKGVITP